MSEVILFGGTTEGRLLARYCAHRRIVTLVCVVSEYGYQVLPESPYLRILMRAMDETMMEELIRQERPALVMDATHPYASVATGNILRACEKTGTDYQRISREETTEGSFSESADLIWVRTAAEAAEYLSGTQGNIFVTTGSKELKTYTTMQGYQERIYARVLPGEEILAQCRQYGITGRHIIAMQGPFSKEINIAMLRHTEARYLVTKEAGRTGGFSEKIEAALACGVITVVIGRPEKPEGISLEEARELLADLFKKNRKEQRKKLVLIGIGMGGKGQMTLEAVERLQSGEVVLGAKRMLESIADLTTDIPHEACYLGKDVMRWLRTNVVYQDIAVVFSGDTGFYSGAKGLLEEMKAVGIDGEYEVEVIPGISTVSYLCARIQTSWEDAYLASIHGRDADICHLMDRHKKVFLLLGGNDSVRKLCECLVDGGYQNVVISVGEKLSYPEERVVTGTAKELVSGCFDTLTAVLIRR